MQLTEETSMTRNKKHTHAAAVIVAAGSGTRMGTAVNKQFLLIDGIPVIAHTLTAFQKAELVDEIIIVAKYDEILTIGDIVREFGITKVTDIVPGGKTRGESVCCGLAHSKCEITAIHDGARPFVSPEKIDASVATAAVCGAAALGVPVKDTVKTVDKSGNVINTPDRSLLRLVQTPQVFRTELLKNAYAHAAEIGFEGTDDCSVAEAAGISVRIIDGEYTNIKITTAEDIPVADAICRFLSDMKG